MTNTAKWLKNNPSVPFIYEHLAKVSGKTADSFLRY